MVITNVLSGIGQRALALFSSTGHVVVFSLTSIGAALTRRESLRAFAVQTVVLSKRCLGPVLLVVAPVAGMMALQTLAVTRSFGVERLVAPLLAATVVRELAPGFSSMMVCFQAGAGIAAELGTMRVQEELDALDVMGVDTRALIVGPRILGAAMAAVVLNAVSIVVGLGAAYVVTVPLLGMSHGLFVETIWGGLNTVDVYMSELKCLVFGTMLGAVSATFGFHVRGGPAGVGRAATQTVVATVILVLVANYVLNTAIFGLRGGGMF